MEFKREKCFSELGRQQYQMLQRSQKESESKPIPRVKYAKAQGTMLNTNHPRTKHYYYFEQLFDISRLTPTHTCLLTYKSPAGLAHSCHTEIDTPLRRRKPKSGFSGSFDGITLRSFIFRAFSYKIWKGLLSQLFLYSCCVTAVDTFIPKRISS